MKPDVREQAELLLLYEALSFHHFYRRRGDEKG